MKALLKILTLTFIVGTLHGDDLPPVRLTGSGGVNVTKNAQNNFSIDGSSLAPAGNAAITNLSVIGELSLLGVTTNKGTIFSNLPQGSIHTYIYDSATGNGVRMQTYVADGSLQVVPMGTGGIYVGSAAQFTYLPMGGTYPGGAIFYFQTADADFRFCNFIIESSAALKVSGLAAVDTSIRVMTGVSTSNLLTFTKGILTGVAP